MRGGRGQPYPPAGMHVLDPELARRRAQALYAIDGAKALRTSHGNPELKQLYAEFLASRTAGVRTNSCTRPIPA